MLYETFTRLKEAITLFHLKVVSARAVMTEDCCPLTVDEL